MKNHCIPLLVLVCTGLGAQNLSLDQAIQSSAKTIESQLPQGAKIAALAFTASNQTFSDYILDELAIAIAANNKILVIDRHLIRKESLSASEGRQLGVQYVITGSLVDIGNAYQFRVIAVNVETAAHEAGISVSVNPEDPQIRFLLTGQSGSAPAATADDDKAAAVLDTPATATDKAAGVLDTSNKQKDHTIKIDSIFSYSITFPLSEDYPLALLHIGTSIVFPQFYNFGIAFEGIVSLDVLAIFDNDPSYKPSTSNPFGTGLGTQIYKLINLASFEIMPFFGYDFMFIWPQKGFEFVPMPSIGMEIVYRFFKKIERFLDIGIGIEYACYFPEFNTSSIKHQVSSTLHFTW